MKELWKTLWWFVWEFTETFNVPLGKLAPWTFSQMTGCKRRRIS